MQLEIENHLPLAIREFYYIDVEGVKHIFEDNSNGIISLNELRSIGILVKNTSNSIYSEGWLAVFRGNKTHIIGPIRRVEAGQTLPIEVSNTDLGIVKAGDIQFEIRLSNATILKSNIRVK